MLYPPATSPAVVLVAAVARNGIIGRGNELVWRDPLDMQHFKTLTQGGTVVMGRKTWESLPLRFRPLPGRRNLVVSRQSGYDAPGAEVVSSFPAALATVAKAGADSLFVIGGGELYALALPYANRLELTEVDIAREGDVRFPDIRDDTWYEAEREEHRTADGIRFAFVSRRLR